MVCQKISRPPPILNVLELQSLRDWIIVSYVHQWPLDQVIIFSEPSFMNLQLLFAISSSMAEFLYDALIQRLLM